MSVSVKQEGHFKDTLNFLKSAEKNDYTSVLKKYGEMGVAALSAATPIDTGMTASSWEYRIKKGRHYIGVEWHNTNVNDGVVVAVLIQYGHATRSGGYVPGRDFINPAMRPILDNLADQLWKEVKG